MKRGDERNFTQHENPKTENEEKMIIKRRMKCLKNQNAPEFVTQL